MLIEFGIINYQLLLPLIYPILFQIRRAIHDETKPFYELLMDFFGYMFGGLIYLFIKYRIKKISPEKKNENEEKITKTNSISIPRRNFSILKDSTFQIPKDSINENNRINMSNTFYSQLNIENIFKQIEKKEIQKKAIKNQYIFLLILSLIYIIPLGLEALTLSDINLNFKAGTSLFYYIFFYSFFSRIILGLKMSNHHFFSLIIIIVCMPVLFTCFIINENEKDYFKLFIHSLYFIFITALFSLYNTLEKKYFNKYMDSPYHLMFVVGSICSSILIIYEIITTIIFGVKSTKYNGFIYQLIINFKENILLSILLFIADVFTAFLWLGGIQLTIYFLSPCHFIISETLSQMLTTIIKNSLDNYSLSIKVIIYIIYTIIIFSSLIYNEVIIINICSLSKDTKKKIILRELTEKNISLTQINEDKEDLEDD